MIMIINIGEEHIGNNALQKYTENLVSYNIFSWLKHTPYISRAENKIHKP